MKKGFTLIELLVVVAIIGILATVVLSNLSASRVQVSEKRTLANINSLRTALELYYLDNNEYPITNVGDCVGYNDGEQCWEGLEQGSTTLNQLLDPYINTEGLRGSGNNSYNNGDIVYLDGRTSLTGCNNQYVDGHYITMGTRRFY